MRMLDAFLWFYMPAWGHELVLWLTGCRMIAFLSGDKPVKFVWSKKYPL